MNILVIYLHRFTYPMRKTIEDHIFSFEKFSGSRFYFVNASFGIPHYLKKISFDLILYQTTFLSSLRWTNLSYEQWTKPFSSLKNFSGVKAILPQDEFLCSDRLCRFIVDFKINKVFSVSPESEWEKIYPGIDKTQVTFHPVLTGYLNQELVDTVKELNREIPERDIDICYRAWHAENWLGRHGLLKTQIAEAFQKASEYHLTTDISTDDKKTFLGLDWYRFLLRSKYTIGVEGGSSILDTDGTIRQKANDYLEKHPDASFEEVERECFQGKDGLLSLFALSPRHLEACMTKTCQILVEGEYNGILKPGVHYIEVKKDFSNIDEVLKTLANENNRRQIVEKAYQDIVLSQNYSYSAFVKTVMATCLHQKDFELKSTTFWHRFNKAREKLLWGRIRFEVLFWKLIKKSLPVPFLEFIRRIKNKYCIH